MSLVRSEEANLMTFCYQGVFLGAFSKAHSCIMYNCCVYKACSNRGIVVVLQTIYSALCSLLENKKGSPRFSYSDCLDLFLYCPKKLAYIKGLYMYLRPGKCILQGLQIYSFFKFVDLLPRLSGFFSLNVLWNMFFFHISVWWNHIYSYMYVVWDNPRLYGFEQRSFGKTPLLLSDFLYNKYPSILNLVLIFRKFHYFISYLQSGMPNYVLIALEISKPPFRKQQIWVINTFLHYFFPNKIIPI